MYILRDSVTVNSGDWPLNIPNFSAKVSLLHTVIPKHTIVQGEPVFQGISPRSFFCFVFVFYRMCINTNSGSFIGPFCELGHHPLPIVCSQLTVKELGKFIAN